MPFLTALWDIFSTGTLYGSTTRLAVFLAFAATGEWVAERAGTLNISVEGMCLVAAFAAVAGSDVTNSALGGVAFGMLAAMVVAAIQGNMSHRLTANQFVVGLAINVLALGLTSFLRPGDRPRRDSRGSDAGSKSPAGSVEADFRPAMDGIPGDPRRRRVLVARFSHTLGARGTGGGRESAIGGRVGRPCESPPA